MFYEKITDEGGNPVDNLLGSAVPTFGVFCCDVR